jgi:Na+/phosphate symporter
MSMLRAFSRRPGSSLLLSAVGVLVVMLVCAFTPIVWVLMGRERESDPELAFSLFGVSASLVLVVLAATYYWWCNRLGANARKNGNDGGGK